MMLLFIVPIWCLGATLEPNASTVVLKRGGTAEGGAMGIVIVMVAIRGLLLLLFDR